MHRSAGTLHTSGRRQGFPARTNRTEGRCNEHDHRWAVSPQFHHRYLPTHFKEIDDIETRSLSVILLLRLCPGLSFTWFRTQAWFNASGSKSKSSVRLWDLKKWLTRITNNTFGPKPSSLKRCAYTLVFLLYVICLHLAKVTMLIEWKSLHLWPIIRLLKSEYEDCSQWWPYSERSGYTSGRWGWMEVCES